jgi:hypothetical protein
MESVPPRGSGWVRSPSVWISLRKCVLEESFGYASTRYSAVVLTSCHVIEAINAGEAPTRYRKVVLTSCHVIELLSTMATHPPTTARWY